MLSTRASNPSESPGPWDSEVYCSLRGTRLGNFASRILFLRGVYAIEDFMVVNKFDLELLIATNEELETYVSSVLSQVERKFRVRPVGGEDKRRAIL